MDLLITLDYELFLGKKTGTVKNCLLEPTQKLITLAKNTNIKMTFFVDVLYLLRLQDFSKVFNNAKDDYDAIMTQLHELNACGHSLQLHIHPQWIYSTYTSLGWNMDFVHYKVDDCSIEVIEKYINKGCKLLAEITGKNPTAYRAGGYCFPKRNNMVAILKEVGITTDSSVVLKESYQSELWQFDYSNLKEYKTYSFYEDICTPTENGHFIEYPISTFCHSHLSRYIVNRYLKIRYKDKCLPMGDGQGVGGVISQHQQKKGIFSFISTRASIDRTNGYWLMSIYRRIRQRNGNVMVIIGHPKNISEYSLMQLEKLLEKKNSNDKVITI